MSPRMSWGLRAAWLAVSDTATRLRLLWLGFGHCLALMEVSIGGAYLLAGQRATTTSKPYTVFAHVFPGGLRLHGLILLALGMTMTACLGVMIIGHREPVRITRRVMLASGTYLLWTAALFAAAPIVPGGKLSFPAVVIWMTFGCLSLLMSIWLPPAPMHRDETELVKVALRMGVAPELARRVAMTFFHGGQHGER